MWCMRQRVLTALPGTFGFGSERDRENPASCDLPDESIGSPKAPESGVQRQWQRSYRRSTMRSGSGWTKKSWSSSSDDRLRRGMGWTRRGSEIVSRSSM